MKIIKRIGFCAWIVSLSLFIVIGPASAAQMTPSAFPNEKSSLKGSNKIKQGDLVFRIKKYYYSPGEKISFSLTNKGKTTVNLRNPAPWHIVNRDGKVVYSPRVIQVITLLRPRKKIKWSWDQQSNQWVWIKPGKYRIVFPQFGSSLPFEITSLPPTPIELPPFYPMPIVLH